MRVLVAEDGSGCYLRFRFGQLRRKLESEPPASPPVAEPGIGYRFRG